MIDQKTDHTSSIAELLRDQARHRPGGVALAASGRPPLTYGRLWSHVAEVVRKLNAIGIGRNDPVALALPNGPEAAVAFVAVACCATAAPLNPAYRAEEYDFYLSDLQAKALIVLGGTESSARAAARQRSIPIFELSPLDEAGLFALKGNGQARVSHCGFAEAENVALVLHTSGTTARPKQVPLTHANLLASAANTAATLGLTEKDRCLNVMPLFHIHGLVGALLSSLVSGGSVVCTSGFDADQFFSWLKEFTPTWYTAVPTMHQAIGSSAQGNGNLFQSHSLRLIRSCSAALAPDVMRELEEVFRVPVIEAYGMTEAAHQIASNPLPPRQHKAGSVGVAAGSEVAVMDEEGNVLAPTEIGEIVIRGPNVMSAYCNNPDANTQSVTSDWFRTGDQGYLDAEGYLFITGRLKEMINRGGEKISPREVDEVLLRHPAVAEAVSFAVAHATLGEDVAAAVVLRKGASTTESELQRFASVRMAEFKVPRRVVLVDQIPRGATGKLQRLGLPERLGLTFSDRAPFDVNPEYAAPRTPLEQKLVAIWSEVLRIERVGIRDNFFHLGGDSVHATRILSRIQEAMGTTFPVSVFFESPTVAGIAKLIETPGTEVQRRRPSPAEKRETGPLSHGQEALWFLDQLDAGNPAYNRPVFARLQGNLNVSVLERCLDELVHRHAVLRASFPAAGDKPIQLIGAHQRLSLPVIDIGHLPEFERGAQAAKITAEEARRPFDLARGPLFRATLLRLAERFHVLLVATHHIVFDGWSSEILLRELAMLYAAFSNNRPSPLRELPIQYMDVVRWQREGMQDDELVKNQLAYWRHQLDGSWPILSMPTDQPRPPIRTSNGASRSFALANGLLETLKEISRQERVSLFMILLATFKTLLYRYSGQEDIIVGTPFAGRNQSSTEDLVGLFINTLPLRTDLSGEPTFREFLARVRTTCLDAHANQDIPFERIVSELQLERDPSRPGIYQVLFQLRNYPKGLAHDGDLVIEQYKADTGGSICDISVAISEEPNGLHCRFDYDTDLFHDVTIHRMWGHFQTLLQDIAANPDRRLSDLAVLTEAERQQLLVEWNDTKRNYPQDRTVHGVFEAQVERTPDAVAVVFEDKQLTYRQLNQRANQLAHHLRKLGVGPEVLVGLCVERSLEMVVGLLGILKSGAAYVPLDPEYPKTRIAHMVGQAKIQFLITKEQPLEGLLPDYKGSAICLDRDCGFLEREQKQNPDIPMTPDHLAYVIYTSGSTGKPKGVLNCHRGVVNYFSYLHGTYDLNDTDTVLQIPSLSFDPSVRDLIGPLTAGAQVVIVNDFDAKDPAALLGQIREHRVTCILSIVPTLLNGLLEAARHEDLRCAAIRVVLVSGEALAMDSCQRAREVFGQTTWLVNQYGPTESTLTCTYHRILETDHHRGIAPLGRPIGNARVYILDDHLRPVSVGVPGELHVGGIGLARGYVNSPELTAERFIPNPFSDDAGARLYKTGDLGRYTADGTIEFLGRIDHQVKIRGFRVELGEIEAVLTEHPAVQQAVAVVSDDRARSDRVIAYVVPNDRRALRKDDLRNLLKSRLPDYMVPSAFVVLDEFPLTPNRKIDRRALPAPDPTEFELRRRSVSPRTPVEEVLAGVWSEVLGLEQVGIHDNFFDLGGHSLLAAKAAARARKAFHIELPLRAMFDCGSLAELAKSVEAALKKAGGLQVPAPRPISRNELPPLSFGQERLWFLNQLEPGNPAYTIFTAWRINGWLDCDRLKTILEAIVRRHEILRTTFPSVDGVPTQAIAPFVAVELPVIDLSELPEVDREAEALRLAGFEGQRPFDLSVGPLLRTTLLKIRQGEYLLLLSLHHIIADGWSMGIIYREIVSSYEALSNGRPLQLPDLPIQYVDFTIWQRKWLQGDFLDAQLSYWKEHLNGSPALLELPADHSRPAIQTLRGAAESFKLSRSLTDLLKTFSLKQGATLFMTLLAAFKTLLSRYTGQQDIVVGAPTAGRHLVETEDTIGFFVNVLLFRLNMSGDPTFQELLRRTREEALAAYAHPDVPFERLIEELKLKRTLSYHSLFQVMFVLHNDYMSSFQPSELKFSRVPVSSSASKFDLTLGMRETKEGLEGRLIYSTDLFEAPTIKRMAGHFHVLLEGIVTNPEQRLSELPMLTEPERRQLLVDWNDTTRDYPKNKSIHELFEAQVTQTPDAVAVVFEDRQMTYRQLNNAANRLALQLLPRGVGKGWYVPTLMDRSIEVPIAMLAIMKAGAAFVPLDIHWPAARIKQILEDLNSDLILVNKTTPFDGQELGRTFIVVNESGDGESVENADVRVDPEQPIYAIYTSGSTGRPKAAVVPHRGINNRFLWMNEFFGRESASSILQTTPHIYDSAVWQLLWPLINGGKTVIPSPGTEIFADHLSALIERHAVTMTDFVPSVFNTIVPQLVTNGEIRHKLRSLRSVVVGGEEITPSTTYTFMGHFPHIRVVNLYGPTEASIGCICYEVTGKEGGLIPIGKPIANVHVLILDPMMNPVPIGVPGELYLSGTCLGIGYLNDDEKTEAAFVHNRFSEIDHPRLYKTGDLARYLPDGNIEFLGRIDHQVKIRGLRIEPGEIESVLARHPAVQQAVVVAWADASGEKRLVAYVVPHSGQSITTGELRSLLTSKLPSYAVPSTFVLLEALPLTPNGKVDRKALPAPDQSRAEPEASYVGPRTPLEEVLVGIWAEILKLERVGVEDNFFDLGGHSLLATRLIARVREAFSVELPLRSLFEAPTVAGLACAIVNGATTDNGELPNLGPVARERVKASS